MLGRYVGLLLCVIGLLLPYRLRVAFSEVLGWLIQALYYAYYGILNHMMSELRKAEAQRREPESGGDDTHV